MIDEGDFWGFVLLITIISGVIQCTGSIFS